MGPNRTFVLGHGARVRPRLAARFGVALAGCTLTLMSLAPSAVASIDQLPVPSGGDDAVSGAQATVPIVRVPDVGLTPVHAQAPNQANNSTGASPVIDLGSLLDQTPVPDGSAPLEVPSLPDDSLRDMRAGSAAGEDGSARGAADSDIGAGVAGDQRSAVPDTARPPDGPSRAVESGPTPIEDDGSTGLGDDGRALGLPLALLAGVGVFLVFTGTATSRSSKFSQAPLHRSGSLRFPEGQP